MQGHRQRTVQGAVATEAETSGPNAVAQFADIAQRDGAGRRYRRRDSRGGRGGAIGEGHDDRQGGAGNELDVGKVGGEEDETFAVADGEVDGHRESVVE